MAPRKKPRTNHSKAGCLTCKRRKVKCSEERPHCNRCIQGGFICNGYIDPPSAWIFYSNNEASKHSSATPQHPATHEGQRSPALSSTPTSSSLSTGNSDPFDAYTIRIGPCEHSLLQLYSTIFVPALFKSRPADVARLLAHFEQETFIGCLQDEAAVYALLSREAAIRAHLSLREGYTAPSMSTLGYMVGSQAVLCKIISLMDGSETPDMVYNFLCTISHLAAAEVMTTSPTPNLHVRALHQLTARYAVLASPQLLQKASLNVMTVVLVDTIKAYLSSSRPTIRLGDWSAYLGQDTSQVKDPTSSIVGGSAREAHGIHEAVEDETLTSVIIKQRGLIRLYRESVQMEMSPMEIILMSVTLYSEVLNVNQLLHIVAEAESHLLTRRLNSERVQPQCARACISLAILLWSQLFLPTSLVVNLVFDVAPRTLYRLQKAVLGSQLDEGQHCELGQGYKEVRLWALSVGVCVELHRKENSGGHIACGEWFLKTFREEARSTDVRSWQQAVVIFDQFLYGEEVKPHICHWWDQVISHE